MSIQPRFVKEKDEYYLHFPDTKAHIPKQYFKIFYDTIICKLKENKCLSEIRPEIIETCKSKVDTEFNTVEETVNLLFYLTLQLRRDLTEKLPDNCTLNDFESRYKQKLMQHALPNPEHEIFDTATVLNYLGDNVFPNNSQPTAIDLWKQQNREIANISVVYTLPNDTQEKLILQQIIQHFLQFAMYKHKKVDVTSVLEYIFNHIKEYDFLNKIPHVMNSINGRIEETKKIMFPSQTVNRSNEIGAAENHVLGKRNLDAVQAPSPERGNKRGHLEPINFNQESGTQSKGGPLVPVAVEPTAPLIQGPNNNNNNNIAQQKPVESELNDFFEKNLELLKNGNFSAGKLDLYKKFSNEGGVLCDLYFSQKLREKFTEILNHELNNIYKHLKEIQPLIKQSNHKELDPLVQKMIQYELAQDPDRSHVEISEKIWEEMEKSRLPYRETFSKTAIQRRISSTKKVI